MTLNCCILIKYEIWNIFMEKLYRKCEPKLAPDPFIISLNDPKLPLHARNSFLNKIIWKRIIKKTLKSLLYFFFRTQSLLMDRVIKNKSGLELVTTHSSDYKTSSKIFLYLLYIIWPSLMMECIAVLELFQKLYLHIYACDFMTS